MIRTAVSVSKSWLAERLGIAFDEQYYFDPLRRHAIDKQCNEYVAETLADLGAFYTESNLGRREWYDTNQVLVGGIQPNMIVGMLMGAEFRPTADADADISPRCLADRAPETLPRPTDLLSHSLVRQWEQDIRGLLDADSDALRPIPPFFWDRSGRAAVHGCVTSGLKFHGDKFLMNLISQPESSRRVVDWLAEVSAVLVSHFSRVARLPVDGIHVGECVACMLDVDSFRRYVVPPTSRLGQHFGRFRFHSCGCSDHILEVCPEITGLAELDVGGETSVGKIRALFGPMFPVGIAPRVEDMRAESEGPILDWYQHVANENQEGDLTIGFHLESDYRLDNLRALHAAVQTREHNQRSASDR